MYSVTSVLLFLILLETLRRLYLALSSPLAKIPGPFHSKFTKLVWLLYSIKGTQPGYAEWLFHNYGPIVRAGPVDILVGSKDLVQKIIVEDDLLKAPLYARADRGRLSSLLSERDNVVYKKRRRLLSHGFAINYLNGLEPIMKECIDPLSELLRTKCTEAKGCATIDIYKMLANLTSDILSATCFGGSFNAVQTNNDYLKRLVVKSVVSATLRALLPFLSIVPFGPWAHVYSLDATCADIIRRRREDLAAGRATKKDLLQILLDAKKTDPETFSEEQISMEMQLFLMAGSDTTSTTAFFALLLLLRNPDKLEHLLGEIETSKSIPSFETAPSFDYLNAVINETTRLLPIVIGGLARCTTDPMMIGGYEVPAGVNVLAFTNIPQKDPHLWTNANAFVPERWLETYGGLAADRKAHIPFSAGLRNCIGQQFALRALRLILATLLSQFTFEIIPGQSEELRFHITPYLKEMKYLVRVKVRE